MSLINAKFEIRPEIDVTLNYSAALILSAAMKPVIIIFGNFSMATNKIALLKRKEKDVHKLRASKFKV